MVIRLAGARAEQGLSIADLVQETATLLREDPGMANLRIQMEAGQATVTADREQPLQTTSLKKK